MSDRLFALIEIISGGVIVIGVIVWQLVSVNREIARDKLERIRSEGAARHAVGEHGLDDRGHEAP